MRRRTFIKGITAGLILSATKAENSHQKLFTLGFGSCNNHLKSQRHWPIIQKHGLDTWVWLGDNLYADTEDMNVMAQKYQELSEDSYYSNFKKKVPIEGYGMTTIMELITLEAIILKKSPLNNCI